MYSLAQAEKNTGKAKSTIWKAIKDGLISASKDERGRFVIDPAELHRVFPIVSEHSENTLKKQTQTPEKTDKTEKTVSELLEMVADLRVELAETRGEKNTLQAKLEGVEILVEELRKTTALLEHMTGAKEGSSMVQNSRSGWVRRFFGGAVA
jgi:ribosomal protein L29